MSQINYEIKKTVDELYLEIRVLEDKLNLARIECEAYKGLIAHTNRFITETMNAKTSLKP